MPKINAAEGQTLEFKRQWTDRALEDLAAFANTEGGTLLVGIRKGGEIVGAAADDREIQRLANLITSRLGITPSIRVVQMEGHPVIEIRVDPARGLGPWGGRYLRRVGTTNRDFPPEELARHILKRSGHTWDALPSAWTLTELDPDALAHFARLARPKLPHLNPENPEQTLAKDPYTPERLRAMGLNDRQIQAVLYVKEHGQITNTDYQGIARVSKPTATRDLEELVSKGVLEKLGITGRGVRYVLRAQKGLIGLTKGSQTAQSGQRGATKEPTEEG